MNKICRIRCTIFNLLKIKRNKKHNNSFVTVGVFHNHNPSNLDLSDQRIRLCCDLNLNPDYESVDLPLEVDQRIQIAWITHNSLKNNGGNMWKEILTFDKFLLYCDIIILYYCIIIYNNI